ncbi:hypothetical protein CW304_14720 [Bacillus sp. UFRGS-B20]|nr:hypothetical protein CW304_14720 [Bacillus sp. UFRGS-B20]
MLSSISKENKTPFLLFCFFPHLQSWVSLVGKYIVLASSKTCDLGCFRNITRVLKYNETIATTIFIAF